jgi:hypothetical protein
MRNKLTVAVCLVVGLVWACLPFVVKNQRYDTIMKSTDLEAHSAILNAFTNGSVMPDAIYPAQVVFGAIMGIPNRLLHIPAETLFLGFMAATLVAIGLVLYWIFNHIEGLSKSWLILLIAMFCTTSIIANYSYGVIYSILNMYIVLMAAIWFMVKWLSKNNSWHLALSLSLAALFSFLHPTSLYLHYAAGVLLAGLVIYKALGWKTRRINRYAIVAVVVLALNVIIGKYYLAQYGGMESSTLPSVVCAVVEARPFIDLQYFPQFFNNILSPITIALGVEGVGGIIMFRKTVTFSKEVKCLLWILGSLAIALLGGALLGAALPFRLLIDLGAIAAMIIGIVLVRVIEAEKAGGDMPVMAYAAYGLVGIGTANTLISWVS